jgi:hypothetical protein
MGNYFTDILSEQDPAKRKENLDQRLAERLPADLIVFTALSVLSDDDDIRRTVLEHVDARNREESGTTARLIELIRSWRREGALMTWPEPMDDKQKGRAAEIEAAYMAHSPLSSAVK